MTKFRKRVHRIAEFDKCLDIIEDNLSYPTESILRIFRERGYSEKTLNNMMKNFYISDKGYNKTIRAYIKRRKNKENLLKRTRLLYKEDKYDTLYISRKTMLLDIVDNYNFCNLHMKGEEVSVSKINLKKFLKETFRGDMFIYPKIKDIDAYESKAIIDNITYHLNDRRWIHSNMKEIVNTNKYMKFNNNFCNYGTVLCNTKEFLKVIMDTNNETTNY